MGQAIFYYNDWMITLANLPFSIKLRQGLENGTCWNLKNSPEKNSAAHQQCIL